MAKGVLLSFSPRADQFAVAAADGRLKTWDIASGHVCAGFSEIVAANSSNDAVGHLALNYKTLAWCAWTKKKNTSLIVLGTGAGDVLAWDSVLGELKWRTNDCNTGGVNSVCFAKDEETLLAAGVDGMVCELDIDSGKIISKFKGMKNGITSISLSPDASLLLVAANELRLFDLADKKRLRKFTGHASAVTVSQFTNDGRYVLSAAVGERNVAVWDTNESGKGAKAVLAMEHPAVALDSWGFETETKSKKILAVSEAGEAYVWSGPSLEELGKSAPVRIRLSSKKQGVLLGQLVGGDSVLIAKGSIAKPGFETLTLPGDGEVVLIPSDRGHLLVPEAAATTKAGLENVTVLGADNAADASLPKPRIDAAEVKKRKRRESNEVAAEPSQNIEENNAEGSIPMEEDRDEQTMEERLVALGLVEENRTEANAFESAVAVPPKSDSLEVLLKQAIRSDDRTLLEQCLNVSETQVITNTIRSLSPKDACTLLKLAISRFESSPRRGLQLMPWIRLTLMEHASYIMSKDSIQPVLRSLYQIVDSRIHTFRPLLALSGRLDLILTKIKANETRKSDQTEVATAAAVYEEDDEESDQDVEDAMADDDDNDDDETGVEKMKLDNPNTLENGGGFSDEDNDQSDED